MIMVILTKEQMLKGNEYIEEMEISELNGSIKIRPLKDYESKQVANQIISGIKDISKLNTKKTKELMKNKKEADELDEETLKSLGAFDVGELMEKEAMSDYMACSFGIIEPIVTIEEIKEFPKGVPKIIANRIKELSGKTKEVLKAAEDFQESQQDKK